MKHHAHRNLRHLGLDYDLESRKWKWPRIAWIAMIVAILIALLGIYAAGPVASANSGLSVRYHYHSHTSSHSEPRVRASSETSSEMSAHTIRMSRELAENLRFSNTSQEPSSIFRNNDEVIFSFDPARDVRYEWSSKSKNGSFQIYSSVSGRGSASVNISQTIY